MVIFANIKDNARLSPEKNKNPTEAFLFEKTQLSIFFIERFVLYPYI